MPLQINSRRQKFPLHENKVRSWVWSRHPGTAKQQLKLFRSFSIFSCLSPFLPVFCWWRFFIAAGSEGAFGSHHCCRWGGFCHRTREKGANGGAGEEERARPLFLTLVRKASLLLSGHRHLLITIETLWEVFPLRCFLCSRFFPPFSFR